MFANTVLGSLYIEQIDDIVAYDIVKMEKYRGCLVMFPIQR